MSTTKLNVIQRIVHNHQAEQVTYTTPTGKQKKLFIDALTASAMLSIYHALPPPSQIKFMNHSWLDIVSLTWKCLTKDERS